MQRSIILSKQMMLSSRAMLFFVKFPGHIMLLEKRIPYSAIFCAIIYPLQNNLLNLKTICNTFPYVTLIQYEVKTLHNKRTGIAIPYRFLVSIRSRSKASWISIVAINDANLSLLIALLT